MDKGGVGGGDRSHRQQTHNVITDRIYSNKRFLPFKRPSQINAQAFSIGFFVLRAANTIGFRTCYCSCYINKGHGLFNFKINTRKINAPLRLNASLE